MSSSIAAPPTPPPLVGPRRTRWARWATGALLAALAFCLVWTPLMGDQSLMLIVGRDVMAGRHLYSGIFDAKQPGMYLWYGGVDLLGGMVAAQLGSVLVVLLTAGVVARIVRPRLADGRVRAWAPFLVVFTMLVSIDLYAMGQTELLMCLPSALAVLLLAGRSEGPTTLPRAALAGVCLGVVVVFKTVLAVVPGIAVLVLLLMSTRRWWNLAAASVGTLVVPAAVVAWLAVRGDLDAALWTWFVYPEEVLAVADVRDPHRLVLAVARFAVLFAPAIVLAAWRVPSILRRREPLDLALLAWLVVGVAVYAVQVWWSYYLLILLPALVVLAVRQLDDLVVRGLRRIVAAGLALLTLPGLVYGGLTLGRALLDGGGVTAASRAQIAERIGAYDTIAGQTAAVLRPDDSLYVLGDPRYQLVADRDIPVTTNGWSAAVLPSQRWDALAGEIHAARPDVVLVDGVSADAMAQRGQTLRAVLDADYRIDTTNDAGTWYRHR